ncbi:predicted protein [Micromonas commoda]|uniref:DNA replication licensing factor MCM5 n=1 Tax=Micromonas commoda (strain RCC299 / NOUM17 / CCMP2709) TaxID=296587 RepID=C1ED12_MICCC|nr:predicted protein [Micromonas commoda]ACO66000.1 predicted protein [Micromonas commoda]|eukprot:XP_002504742.1 predicted protein [Micromonas commoda]
MAGWDEGNVYYTDLGDGDGRPGRDGEGVTPGQARRKFADFLRNFRSEPTAEYPDGRLVYRDKLDQDTPPRDVTVLLDDIIAHDPELAKEVRNQPDIYIPCLEHAAVAVVESLRNEAGLNPQKDALVTGVGGSKDMFDKLEIQVHLVSDETPASVRSLNSAHVSKLVYIPGIVIAAAKAKTKATRLCLQCRSCRSLKYMDLKPGFGGMAQPPRRCEANGTNGAPIGAPGGTDCGLDPYVPMADKSKFCDVQTLKLQENPEDVPAGEMPRHMILHVERTMVQRITPGTRVKVMGVYTLSRGMGKAGGSKRGRDESSTISTPYIRVVGMTEESEGARGDAHFTDAEHTEFKAFAARPFKEVIGDIRSRIAPAIFGADDIKAAVASLLFSGSRKTTQDGAKLRGDVNVLLMGDPSTAKSQFLKFVEKTAPICVYTSGKGSSAAGLTASVVRDSDGGFMLEGGAMVLADGGCVCIDEFDKMRDEDRVAIHEAMEQQTISIAKAGITTVLNSRAAVLAAANPPSGRYDDLKTAQENIDLQTTILSRFDLIFIVRDERLYERDLAIADHVLGIHAGHGGEIGDDGSIVPVGQDKNPEAERQVKFLKRYVEYCRATCSPRLVPTSAKLLEDQYVRYRQEMRDRAKKGGAPAVPITVRQLEAITRVSESLAKMTLQKHVTEEHVQEALRLFEVSTIDAARSGVADMVVLTPEQREELMLVETQIKQKLAIGATASKRHLVEDLGRLGVNEWAVMRALMIMSQRGEIQERAEGRRVTRVH